MADNRQSALRSRRADRRAGAAPRGRAPKPRRLPTSAGRAAGSAPRRTPDAPLREQQLDKQGRAYATGRRKDAVARVWLKPGTGKIIVNGRDQEVYFARPTLRLVINQLFGIAERAGQYDVVAPSRAAASRARPARSSTASARR